MKLRYLIGLFAILYVIAFVGAPVKVMPGLTALRNKEVAPKITYTNGALSVRLPQKLSFTFTVESIVGDKLFSEKSSDHQSVHASLNSWFLPGIYIAKTNVNGKIYSHLLFNRNSFSKHPR